MCGSGCCGSADADAAATAAAAAEAPAPSGQGGDPGATAGGGAPSAAAAAAGAEDDGYLMTFTWSAGAVGGVKGGDSHLAIFDARSMHSTPVARLGLGGAHVPYGFHGAWVPADGPQGGAEGVETPVEAGVDAAINGR